MICSDKRAVFTSRILPPEEWPRLTGTLLETVWPNLSPADARVVVVERDGEIVGCAVLFSAWHLEGAWIAPVERGRISVGRRLLRTVRDAVAQVQAREVFMMATDDRGRRLCKGLGTATHLACDHFAVQMETRAWAHQA